MRNNKIIIIFLIFITSFLIGNLFINQTNANSDLYYEFSSDRLFDKSDLLNETSFNIRNQTLITETNYTATYDFLDDSIGGNPSNWNIDESGGSINIIESLFGHNNIVDINDTLDSAYNILFNNSLTQSSGTLEFWIFVNDSTKTSNIWIYDGLSEHGVYIYIDESKFYYLNGGSHEITSCINDIWYHIRIDFECGLGSYKGLSADTFYIYINNFKYGSYSMRGNPSEMDTIAFTTGTADYNYHIYLDAIGFSWYNYIIGQNIKNFNITKTDITEIDKCEFAYDVNTGLPNAEGSSNPNNWIDIDDGNNEIQVLHQSDQWQDCYVHCDIWFNDFYGITKEFNQLEGLFNITMEIDVLGFFYINGFFEWNIYSYDDTLIVKILLKAISTSDYRIYYYDGSNNILLYSLTSDYFQDLKFNLYINNNGNCILEIQDYEINNIYPFSKIDISKKGINTIEFKGKNGGGSYAECYVDNIGVYINGSSYLADDLLTIKYDTDFSWNSNNHNLLYIKANGTFSFIVYDNSLNYTIFPFTKFNNTKQMFPNFDAEFNVINPLFVFVINSSISITITEIYAEGTCLIEGINKYYPSFTYNNIDIQENYFYVSNNRLYFTHYANENDTLEYIQLKFNIDNVYAINRSINFKTYFLGISKAYFKVNYVSETNSTFDFPLGYNPINQILPQQQIIKNLIILITDKNNNDYYGKSEGYVSNINLRYYPDIQLTLLTISLIEVMIPLIVLLIPTIAIASIYGKKAIIPMLILMTLICFIAGLIRVEIFFIMMLCLGSAMFLQYKKEREKS